MDDFDKALMELNNKHQNVGKVADRIRLFDDTDNLYLWSNVSDCMIKNFESTEIATSHKCPLCNGYLSKTLVESFSEFSDLYFCEHCRAQFDSEYNRLINSDSLIRDIKDIDLSSINPSIAALVNDLIKMGCNPFHYNRGGMYGYVIFEYKGVKLGITIDDSYSIMIFYPNWLSIPHSDLTSQLISLIQNNNLNSDCNIFWLLDDNNFLLSSTINLEADAVKQTDYVLTKLNTLIDSKDKICRTSDSAEVRILQPETQEKIQAILTECGCCVQEVDDDGDIWFKYRGKDMYAHMIGPRLIKLVNNCMELNYIDQYSGNTINDVVDHTALTFQWVNMIYPVKVTYYKPNECQYSVTASTNIAISHFVEHNIDKVTQILDDLSNADGIYISDIIFGTEKGINLVDAWYQPNISNLLSN